jgi:hypothetical protein
LKSSGSGSRKSRSTAVGIHCADHATPFVSKSWDGFRSVGIVRLRTKATEFSLPSNMKLRADFEVVLIIVCNKIDEFFGTADRSRCLPPTAYCYPLLISSSCSGTSFIYIARDDQEWPCALIRTAICPRVPSRQRFKPIYNGTSSLTSS